MEDGGYEGEQIRNEFSLCHSTRMTRQNSRHPGGDSDLNGSSTENKCVETTKGGESPCTRAGSGLEDLRWCGDRDSI